MSNVIDEKEHGRYKTKPRTHATINIKRYNSSITDNFSNSIVLMCLIVSSGLRFSNSVNTLNNVLTFQSLKGKVIIKLGMPSAFDHMVHITEGYKNNTRNIFALE
jgi:hypothetical protein